MGGIKLRNLELLMQPQIGMWLRHEEEDDKIYSLISVVPCTNVSEIYWIVVELGNPEARPRCWMPQGGDEMRWPHPTDEKWVKIFSVKEETVLLDYMAVWATPDGKVWQTEWGEVIPTTPEHGFVTCRERRGGLTILRKIESPWIPIVRELIAAYDEMENSAIVDRPEAGEIGSTPYRLFSNALKDARELLKKTST